MSDDRGDSLSAGNIQFLLYQNAMAELAEYKSGAADVWWDLIREGFQAKHQHYNSASHWISVFEHIAKQGDENAIALLRKVAELRLRS